MASYQAVVDEGDLDNSLGALFFPRSVLSQRSTKLLISSFAGFLYDGSLCMDWHCGIGRTSQRCGQVEAVFDRDVGFLGASLSFFAFV